MARETKLSKILKYMESHEGISPMEAVELFNCYRLSAEIFHAKKRGYLIETEIRKSNGTRYAFYKLRGKENELDG